jgi:short-subunit dehydrogenase
MLITGASQGIGRAIAVAAARRGARLILTARNEAMLQELGDECRRAGAEVEIVVGDITSGADRKRMIDAAVHRFEGLDLLINNAGVGATGHFIEATEERLRKIMEVNFFALAELTRLAIPVLQEGNKPAIVNISSAVGKRALPARSEYSASKFAVQGLTEALRGEMVRFGIDVLSICPGLTATNFSQNMIENRAKVPLDHMRSMTADQVAVASLRAIEKGKNEIVLTWKAKLMILLNRFFPRLVDAIIRRKVRKLYREEIEQREQRQRQRSQEAVKV